MSTTRCKHGRVIEDTCGSYRCDECDPLAIDELDEVREQLQAQIDELRERVETLERERSVAAGRVTPVSELE